MVDVYLHGKRPTEECVLILLTEQSVISMLQVFGIG